MCAIGVSLGVARGAEGTMRDGLGWYGTKRKETRRGEGRRMIKRMIRRCTGGDGGGELDY